MKKYMLINLFGTAGKRTVEITPHGGFTSRHVKVPLREVPVPSLPSKNHMETQFPPVDRTSKEVPETPTLLEVIRWMEASENHTGWLIIDEILFVATTQYDMKFNQQSLLDALRLLYQEGCLAYKLNRFDQHMFRLIENHRTGESLATSGKTVTICEPQALQMLVRPQEPTLKSLLAEVDAIMDEGGAA